MARDCPTPVGQLRTKLSPTRNGEVFGEDLRGGGFVGLGKRQHGISATLFGVAGVGGGFESVVGVHADDDRPATGGGFHDRL